MFSTSLYQNLYLSSYDEVIIIHLFLEKSSRGITRNFTNSGTVVNSCYIFLAMPIISRQSVVTNIVKVLYGFVFIINL